MALILNKKEYAEARGVSERTVTRWLSDGLPHNGSGKKGDPIQIELNAAIKWEVDREVSKQLGGRRSNSDDEETTFEQEELKKLRAERKIKESEAELKALELGQKNGELVDLGDVEVVIAEAMTQLSMILKPVGRRVIPEVKTAMNEAAGLAIWDDEVTRAFTVAAELLESMAIDGCSNFKIIEDSGEDH